ncbi:MAG TPA: Gfo/Idh/MocA family oxidoreductase [bacterium]|nr:Gfo/Idh/MocA family oxidoreductase [bacterium]
MEDRVLNFAIIGCGVIAPNHAEGIVNTPSARLVAVADIVEEKAVKFAQKYNCDWYTDYKKMLDRPDIDVVNICTPSGLHPEMAIEAMKRGKHVITEKPMAITLEQADAMISASKEYKRKLACIFQRRTQSIFKKIKEVTSQGAIGKLILGDAYMKYFRSQAYYDSGDWRGTWALDGGGALMNQGIHCIDLMQWIMGEVGSVFAYTRTLARKIEVEDTAVSVLEYKNGAIGIIEGTTSVVPGFDHRLEFHGVDGSILVNGEKIARWEVPGLELKLDSYETAGSTASDPRVASYRGHQILIQDMIDAIKNDRDPLIPGEEGKKALKIILAIYKSSKERKEVYLDTM